MTKKNSDLFKMQLEFDARFFWADKPSREEFSDAVKVISKDAYLSVDSVDKQNTCFFAGADKDGDPYVFFCTKYKHPDTAQSGWGVGFKKDYRADGV